ncbi:helix-turn-helix domain-containing protein [Erysipelothrix sp. D19-032]
MKEIFDRHEFGKKLKDARKSIGLTQSQLAEKTGFSQNTISNWENGVREPRIYRRPCFYSRRTRYGCKLFCEEYRA